MPNSIGKFLCCLSVLGVVLATFETASAQVVTSGEVVIGDFDGDGFSDDLTLDTIQFHVSAGTTVNFDALIFEGPNATVGDRNGDGEITAADGGMVLLDPAGQLLVAHDDGPPGDDGSFTGFDGNFTYMFADAGTYALAVGAAYRRNYSGGYLLTASAATQGYLADYGDSLAFDQDHADWQVTLTATGGTLSNVVVDTLGIPATPNPNDAPDVSCSVESGILWSPNKTTVDVGLQISATDDHDLNPQVQLLVYCNETDRDATGGDAFETFDGLSLRAERNGNGTGRVYLIVLVATDSLGATSFDCCSVVVPHDESESALAIVEVQALLAELMCLADGVAPEEYRLVNTD